ncbi:MAG: hypothetical protein RL577_1002 [Bacteroidota bacterium]
MTNPRIVLKPGKENSLQRQHPWVFSGAIAQAVLFDDQDLQIGDWVDVVDHKERFLAKGHYSDGSIAVRILSWANESPEATYTQKIQAALSWRHRLGLPNPTTNAFRLIHGEGDLLPGLIIDMYAQHAVVQAHSWGIHRDLPLISQALQTALPKLESIYSKSKAALHSSETQDHFLLGSSESCQAQENGWLFGVNWVEGQKTGFFLDQRVNRALLAQYAQGKQILNTFCYTGGFSIAALKGGADFVKSVDVSSRAMAQTDANIALNGFKNRHESITADALKYLSEDSDFYDIVVLDPPAFAKNLRKKHAAVMGYKRLNALGMKRVKPGGLLFTFSCSQVVDDELFRNTVTAAGLEAGRTARVIHRLNQGPDHPEGLYHPEGHYLKGLVLAID